MMKPSMSTLVARAFVALIVVAMLLVVASGSVVAADSIKIVRGYIRDSAGTPLVGASVLVEMIKPDKTLRKSYTFTTNDEGFYSVVFAGGMGPSEWEPGDTINVTSDYSGNVAKNSTLAVYDPMNPIQFVNVTYTYEIPEFGSSTGLLVAAGAIGLVACVALLWTRRKP